MRASSAIKNCILIIPAKIIFSAVLIKKKKKKKSQIYILIIYLEKNMGPNKQGTTFLYENLLVKTKDDKIIQNAFCNGNSSLVFTTHSMQELI